MSYFTLYTYDVNVMFNKATYLVTYLFTPGLEYNVIFSKISKISAIFDIFDIFDFFDIFDIFIKHLHIHC